MLGRVLVISWMCAVLALALVMQSIDPTQTGPLGILIVFILIYLSLLGVLTFLLYGVSRAIRRLTAAFTVKKPFGVLSLSRSYYLASVIALAPVMFIGMQSVGEVGVYEVVLVVLFVAIGCFYIAKRTS